MRRQKGFSLLEIMVAVGVFVIITGVVFQLLLDAQQRYKAETEFLDTFQSARIGLDQIVRDVHTTGYPPINTLPAAAAALNPNQVAEPFAWTATYPLFPCTVLGSCNAPGGPSAFDLILETDIDPENANGVEWVRYQLVGNILRRGIASKAVGVDPVLATNVPGVMVPYIENVMNNATQAQMAAIQANYPAMFPGNAPVPVFRFRCGIPAAACTLAGPTPDTSRDITEVTVSLIVQAPNPDLRTRQLRVVTLTGLARRINP
ncbi:MAG: type II secretion system GspH family protein [Verrucomicrobia subdivision 3 bacterium]|nr:type II secretion system GspH family protein [Limisphaerales bacterium]